MSSRTVRRLAVAATAGLLVALGAGSGAYTYARFTDHFVIHDNQVGAAVWQTPPPAACGDVSKYDQVVYLTQGDDVWPADGKPPVGNKRQIIMGYGGNDTIYGGNSGDCIVGGDGDDTLHGGNATDIIIGGTGDDKLYGDNGPDTLDGGLGTDYCDDGLGPAVVMKQCEELP